jgi:Mlc titration factor MtfA (ptsG expression regulator)
VVTSTVEPTIPLGRRAPRRRALYAQGFLPEWRDLVAERVSHWNVLRLDERDRLELLTLRLLADKHWEAGNGFALTDEMQLVIAAQAALLILALPDDSFRRVRTVLVLPTTLMLRGEHSRVPGLMSREPLPILGLAQSGGTVLITWDAARRDARHPGNGHNVVFHEFAHQLDMLSGTVNGTPPLATQEQFDRWVEVCTRVYHQVQRGEAGESISSYAGVNTGEFFAVATEVFFDDPHGLQHDHLDLYEVLAAFYRQDPSRRMPYPTDRWTI